MLARWNLVPVSLLAAFSLFASPAAAADIDWVTVPGADVACDPQPAGRTEAGCYGRVTYTYRISETETTNRQYAEFLNAVDPDGLNALDLYNSEMESSPQGGIGFVAGNPIGERYLTKVNFPNKPVNHVDFYDALRFANWLHNGQGSGDTETGSYTLSDGSGVTRNAGATIFLASEDEWYKAAYYDAVLTSYFDYPVGSDTQTSCDTDTALSNTANCRPPHLALAP